MKYRVLRSKERVTQYERQRKKSCQVLEGRKGDDLAKLFPERVILLAAWSDAPSKRQPALPLSDHRKQSAHEQKSWAAVWLTSSQHASPTPPDLEATPGRMMSQLRCVQYKQRLCNQDRFPEVSRDYSCRIDYTATIHMLIILLLF